jgi:hypothetical protein
MIDRVIRVVSGTNIIPTTISLESVGRRSGGLDSTSLKVVPSPLNAVRRNSEANVGRRALVLVPGPAIGSSPFQARSKSSSIDLSQPKYLSPIHSQLSFNCSF